MAFATKGKGGKSSKKKFKRFTARKRCHFCEERKFDLDYKDLPMIQKNTSPQGKMLSRRRTGNCATHQKRVKEAVLRARFLGLIPYVA